MGGESCTVLRLRLMRKLAMPHIGCLIGKDCQRKKTRADRRL